MSGQRSGQPLAPARPSPDAFGGREIYFKRAAKAESLSEPPPEVAAFVSAHCLMLAADAALPPTQEMAYSTLLDDSAALERLLGPRLSGQQEDAQLRGAWAYLVASYCRVAMQPKPLHFTNLPENTRFYGLLAGVKRRLVLHPSPMLAYESSILGEDVAALLRSRTPACADARLLLKLLLAADVDLVIGDSEESKAMEAKALLDVVASSLQAPGVLAAVDAQLRQLTAAGSTGSEAATKDGASGAASLSTAAAETGSSSAGEADAGAVPAGMVPAMCGHQLYLLCRAMQLQVHYSANKGSRSWWELIRWCMPAADELVAAEPWNPRHFYKLGQFLDQQAVVWAQQITGRLEAARIRSEYLQPRLAAAATWERGLEQARAMQSPYWSALLGFNLFLAATALVTDDRPPIVLHGLMEEAEDAYKQCQRSCLPFQWVEALRMARDAARVFQPTIEEHMQQSPRRWNVHLNDRQTVEMESRVAAYNDSNKWKEKDTCDACGQSCIALSCCSKCRSAYYCSRECQVRHWRTGHREECKRLADAKDGRSSSRR